MAIVKAYRAYYSVDRKQDQQDHDQKLELSEHLEARLQKVEGRMDAAESELRDSKRKLTQSRIREDELQAAIDALVQRIDQLINRLEQHEQISEDERDRLTSVPYGNTDSSDSNA